MQRSVEQKGGVEVILEQRSEHQDGTSRYENYRRCRYGGQSMVIYSDRVTWGKNFSMPNLNYIFFFACMYSPRLPLLKVVSIIPFFLFLLFFFSRFLLCSLSRWAPFTVKILKDPPKKRERERDSVLERV